LGSSPRRFSPLHIFLRVINGCIPSITPHTFIPFACAPAHANAFSLSYLLSALYIITYISGLVLTLFSPYYLLVGQRLRPIPLGKPFSFSVFFLFGFRGTCGFFQVHSFLGFSLCPMEGLVAFSVGRRRASCWRQTLCLLYSPCDLKIWGPSLSSFCPREVPLPRSPTPGGTGVGVCLAGLCSHHLSSSQIVLYFTQHSASLLLPRLAGGVSALFCSACKHLYYTCIRNPGGEEEKREEEEGHFPPSVVCWLCPSLLYCSCGGYLFYGTALCSWHSALPLLDCRCLFLHLCATALPLFPCSALHCLPTA